MSRGPVACPRCRAPFVNCGKVFRCWLCGWDADKPVAIAAAVIGPIFLGLMLTGVC